MRVQRLTDTPLFSVAYRNAKHHGGASDVPHPVFGADATDLPPSLDGLLIASDLQGRMPAGEGEATGLLLGQGLAEAALGFCKSQGLEPAGRVGVLLAGDLHANVDLRRLGGLGEVRPVYEAFAQRFAFVVGVLGNHDQLGEPPRGPSRSEDASRICILDAPVGKRHQQCSFVTVAGLRVAGVSGIVGDPARPNRHTEEVFLARLARALDSRPHVLLLHQNPALPDVRRAGSQRMTDILAARARGLVVFGHSWADQPLRSLGQAQLLATEGRAFLISRA